MSVYSSGDSVNAIVADIGSYATKIGFAGEDYPRAYFRSVRHCEFFAHFCWFHSTVC